jgi:hypothetical protein
MTDLKGKMLIHIIVLTILTLIAGCENAESIPECSYSEPMEELTWLRNYAAESTNCTCQISLMQGTYTQPGKHETVFFKLENDPLCNSVFGAVLYNCAGETVKAYGAGDSDQFSKEVKIDKTLQACKN